MLIAGVAWTYFYTFLHQFSNAKIGILCESPCILLAICYCFSMFLYQLWLMEAMNYYSVFDLLSHKVFVKN